MKKIMKNTKYFRFCRVCAYKKDVSLLVPIVGNELHGNVSQKLNSIQIPFTADDELPQEICHQCLQRVDTWHAFSEKCKKAQQRLFAMKYTGFNFQETICEEKKNSKTVSNPSNNILLDNKELDSLRIFDDDVNCESSSHCYQPNYDDLEVILEKEENEDRICDPEYEVSPVEDDSKAVLEVEAEKKFNCTRCDKKYQTRAGLRCHEISIHESKSFICENCGKDFKSKNYLNVHMKSHLPDSVRNLFFCSMCDKRFSSKGKVREHLNTHYDERPFVCSVCKKSFKQYTTLYGHMETHKEPSTASRVYYCSQCEDRPFLSRRLLLRHIGRHARSDDLVRCKMCNAQFQDRSQVKKHWATIHSQEDLRRRLKEFDTKVAKCPKCEQVLLKRSLQRHMLCHNEQREGVTCEQCGKRFKCSSSLYYHNRTAHSIIGLLCRFCEASFKTEEMRRRHEYTHTGETPFKCTQCDKSFRSAGSLRQHSLVHKVASGEHTCQLCDKQFKRKSALLVHTRIHTGDLPYDCSTCSKRFAQKNDRDRHEKAIHWKCVGCGFVSMSLANEKEAHLSVCEKMVASKKRYEFEKDDSAIVATTCLSDQTLGPEPEENLVKVNTELHTLIDARTQVVEHSRSSVLGEVENDTHLLQDLGSIHYLCTVCNVTFDSEQRLNTHFARLHSQDSRVDGVHFQYSLQ